MNKRSLIAICPLQTISGYGIHSRIILRSLLSIPEITDNFDIKVISLKWGSTPMNALDPNNPEDRKLLDLMIPELNFTPDISIHITIPSEAQRIGKKSILITAGTEGSLAPESFLKGCNQVDLVITPSEFTKAILANSKLEKRDKSTNNLIELIECKTPIQVLFEGIDTSIYSKINSSKGKVTEYLDKIPESFNFLFCGHFLNAAPGHDRKDVWSLIETFINTFRKKSVKNRPGLILKTSGAGFSITERDQIIEKINQIQDSFIERSDYNGSLPNIYLLNGELSDLEMNELYNHNRVKAMVSFTHAEGFGLPLAEFTMSGKPVIASNFSGQLDFLHPEYSVLLPGKMIKVDRSAVNEWIIDGSEWFQVNYTYASQVLGDVYANYPKYLEKSRKHPKYTKDNFSIERMSQKFLEILKESINLLESEQKPMMTIKLPQLKKLT